MYKLSFTLPFNVDRRYINKTLLKDKLNWKFDGPSLERTLATSASIETFMLRTNNITCIASPASQRKLPFVNHVTSWEKTFFSFFWKRSNRSHKANPYSRIEPGSHLHRSWTHSSSFSWTFWILFLDIKHCCYLPMDEKPQPLGSIYR